MLLCLGKIADHIKGLTILDKRQWAMLNPSDKGFKFSKMVLGCSMHHRRLSLSPGSNTSNCQCIWWQSCKSNLVSDFITGSSTLCNLLRHKCDLKQTGKGDELQSRSIPPSHKRGWKGNNPGLQD